MTEDLLLDNTLEILDTQGYEVAYKYLLDHKHLLSETDANASLYYFLSCLAAGSHQTEAALNWLEEAIITKGYWYRPEMLEDDDLAILADTDRFKTYIQLSENRFLEAQSSAKPMCTWQQKQKSNLLLSFHGNGENALIALNTWRQLERDNLQIESLQSSRVHAFDRFRWHYDDTNYKEALTWLEPIERSGYGKLVLGGFSAGCDMILRLLTLSDTSCHTVLLQSPWTPFIETHGQAIADAFKQKNIKVSIYCGALDKDSLEMANQLHDMLKNNHVNATLEIQPNLRHQFPELLGETYHSVI